MIQLLATGWLATAQAARILSPMATEWGEADIIETGTVSRIIGVPCSDKPEPEPYECSAIELKSTDLLKGKRAYALIAHSAPECVAIGCSEELDAIRIGDTVFVWGTVEREYLDILGLLTRDDVSGGVRPDALAVRLHFAWSATQKAWPDGSQTNWGTLASSARTQLAADAGEK